MKKIYLFTTFILTFFLASAQDFITVWDLSKSGSTANSIKFGVGTTGTVSYTWETIPAGIIGNGTFTGSPAIISGLPTNAKIKLKINPSNFYRININNGIDKDRLVDVVQWGSVIWSTMDFAFYGCRNLNITSTDIPNLSNVQSMYFMFNDCNSLNGPSNINSWNTSSVTNMYFMFLSAHAFNQPIGNWNVGNVKYFQGMFEDATTFNQPIGNWNTSNAIGMQTMFHYAHAFNQPIGNWNTNNVTGIIGMFAGATSFNQPIGNWNISNVNSLYAMFWGANSFNQPIGNWNTSNVEIMASTFKNATSFNQSLANWNTTSVKNMANMFQNATSYNQSLDNWNLQSISTTANTYLLLNMLDSCGMDCINYATTLQGWANNSNTPHGLVLGASNIYYNASSLTARNILTNTKGWTIVGDILNGGLANANNLNILSVPGNTCKNQSQTDGSTLNYYGANCDNLIATIVDATGGNTLGNVNACVTVYPTIQTYNGQPYLARVYDITPANQGPSNITLYYTQDDFNDYNANAGTYPQINADTLNGTVTFCITQVPTGILGSAGTTVHTVTATWNSIAHRWEVTFPVTSFSGFYCHACNPNNSALPFTIYNFKGVKKESSDLLTWLTSSEINASYFSLLHSVDGISFNKIGQIKSKSLNGNSNTDLQYHFENTQPQLGHNYYQLEQVDFDDKKIINTQTIDLFRSENGNIVTIYPNPTIDELNIDIYVNTNQKTTIKVLDMSGRIVKESYSVLNFGTNTIKLNLANLTSGVYTIQVLENNKLTQVQRINKY